MWALTTNTGKHVRRRLVETVNGVIGTRPEPTYADGLGKDIEIVRAFPADSSSVVGDVYSPDAVDRAPVVVMLHGCCGMREDLTRYSLAVAGAGSLVYNVSWRCLRTGDSIRQSIKDITAAVKVAHDVWERPVTLAAWSDGALPATLAMLEGESTGDAFVGLSGFYGWAQSPVPSEVVNRRTISYIGDDPKRSPTLWSAANPYERLAVPPRRFALFVGERDLALGDTLRFHAALESQKHHASVEILEECEHSTLVVPRLPAGRESVARLTSIAREIDT